MALKLFLTSNEILPSQYGELEKLVGKKLDFIKCALIENGADPYGENEQAFVTVNRDALLRTEMHIVRIDLRTFEGNFDEYELIWLGGGNTFYLRYILKDFEDKIRDHVEKGKVLAGSSAGTLVVGPSIEEIDNIDDPYLSPEIIGTGLGLTKYCVLSHKDNPKFKEELAKSVDRFKANGHEVIQLDDGQVFVQPDDGYAII
jgi:dipeptidase E